MEREGWRGYVVTDRQAIRECTSVDNKEFSRKRSFMHCVFILGASFRILEIFPFLVSCVNYSTLTTVPVLF